MVDAKIIVALDTPSAEDAMALASRLDPTLCKVKVGLELFTAAGPGIVGRLAEKGFPVFLDLKFHDIPVTVAHACRSAAGSGAWMMNVHTLGGVRMMAAAREALEHISQRPLLIGVTVLTSHSESEIRQLGFGDNADDAVSRLAGLALESGLDGVVCSALEATRLRQQCGPDFRLITPGIRPSGDAVSDQRRVTTPELAIAAGADYLVIGRPITGATDPGRRLAEIARSISQDS